MKNFMTTSVALTSTCLLAAGAFALTGCSDNTVDSKESTSASASATAELTVSDTWAKAAESGMTAVFGEVTNTSDHDITITGAYSTATDAANTQLHTTEMNSETGSSEMKQVESFTIAAGETLSLKPGGDHIMLMDLTCSLPAGTHVNVTLETEDGAEVTFEAGARDYSGAKEEYAPGEEHTADEHSGHDHSGHNHGSHESSSEASAEETGAMGHSGHPGNEMSSEEAADSAALPQCS